VEEAVKGAKSTQRQNANSLLEKKKTKVVGGELSANMNIKTRQLQWNPS